MRKKQKTYEQPQMDVVRLQAVNTLLAGSTGATNDGYGQGIPEGEQGWH